MHEGVKYNCNICQHIATHIGNLRLHVKAIHLKEKYQCKICKYQATRKSSLSIHISNVHQNSENINCHKSVQKSYLEKCVFGAFCLFFLSCQK